MFSLPLSGSGGRSLIKSPPGAGLYLFGGGLLLGLCLLLPPSDVPLLPGDGDLLRQWFGPRKRFGRNGDLDLGRQFEFPPVLGPRGGDPSLSLRKGERCLIGARWRSNGLRERRRLLWIIVSLPPSRMDIRFDSADGKSSRLV